MSDFQRLILALPPPRSLGDALDREAPRTPASARSVAGEPAGQNPDSYTSFLRSDETLSPYLTGRNPLAMAESVRSWFVGDSASAVEARGNYIARDTALSITFIAFHESRDPRERERLLTFFIEGMQGQVETLRQIGNEGRPESLSESADALLRLSILSGLLLRDLEGSGLSEEQMRTGRTQIQENMRQAYSVVDRSVGSDHPEWRHLQEFVRAMSLAQQPPSERESMGRYVEWIGEIHEHLDQAEAAMNARSEYREEITALLQSTRSALPACPGAASMSRGFISHMTLSFVTVVASEIDQENGDSPDRVSQRYETLMASMESDLASHPDSSFEESLNRLTTGEALHLRRLVQDSALLRELIAADRQALVNPGSLSTGQIVSRWGEEVLTVLERHSLNWGENFLARGEQHLGSTRSILQFFHSREGEASLNSALTDFAGRGHGSALSERLSRRAEGEWNSLDSTGFGVASGASHFLSIHSVPFVAGGALLSRLSEGALFALAGENGSLAFSGIRGIRSLPFLRSVPVLGRTVLIEGGEMTGLGRFASATATGTGLSLGFSSQQLLRDLAAGRPEAWPNFGRNLGLGILVNTAALGLSALLSVGLRRAWATPRGVGAAETASSGRFSSLLERLITPRRALLYYGGHAALGTAGMIGTNALIRGIHNAGVPESERVPYTGADEITETYLNLIAMNLAELPLQRLAVRRQLGVFRTRTLETLSREIVGGRPEVEGPLTAAETASQERVFQFLALRNLRGVPLETLRSEGFRDYAARTFLPPRPSSLAEEAPVSTAAGPGTESTPPGDTEPPADASDDSETVSAPIPLVSPAGRETVMPPADTTVTARVPVVTEEGSRPSRPRHLSQTIRGGSSSDTSTQIIQPQRNFLNRLRDRILSTRVASERRYVVVTLRENGEEFDPEASLRTVRYQETLPEARPRQIILERPAQGSDAQRVVLITQNLEGVSDETQAFMRLFLEQTFPRSESPSAPSAPAAPAPSEPTDDSSATRRSSPPPSAPESPAPAAPPPARPPLTARGDSLEDAFAGLAEEMEAESGESSGAHPRIPTPPPPPPAARESSPGVSDLSEPFATPPPGRTAEPVEEERPGAPEPTRRMHLIELKTQAAIEHRLNEYFSHPIPGLLRLIQDADGRRSFEWHPGGLGTPPPRPVGGRILATVRITGDLSAHPDAYTVIPSLGQESWATLIENAMRGIVRNRTHSRGE